MSADMNSCFELAVANVFEILKTVEVVKLAYVEHLIMKTRNLS